MALPPLKSTAVLGDRMHTHVIQQCSADSDDRLQSYRGAALQKHSLDSKSERRLDDAKRKMERRHDSLTGVNRKQTRPHNGQMLG